MFALDFIIFLAIFFVILNLRGRIQELERIVNGGNKNPANEYYQPTQKEKPYVSVPPSPETFAPQYERVSQKEERFIAWVKEDWLLKLGALLLLIGFGWLTTYAFLNNWIGPAGRITLGIVAGTSFLLFGWLRIKKYIHQGGVFLVLGSTVVLLTTFAAREFYDFFTPASALVLMFLSTAFVALASVRYSSRALALSSLILAGIAPLLTGSHTEDYVSLFAYLLIVVLGAIWVVALTGQRSLTPAALALVSLYSLPHFFSFFSSSDAETLLPFAYAFATVFFFTNIIGIVRSKEGTHTADMITAAGNGLFLLAWILAGAPDEWKSLIIAAWMIVFVTGAFLIFKATQKREPFFIYAGVGIAMLAAATAVELRGATLVIAYTIECGMISLISYALLRNIRTVEQTCLLFFIPAGLSFSSIDSYAWETGVFHKDFFVLFVLGATLFGLGVFFFMAKAKWGTDSSSSPLVPALTIVGSVYFYVLLWLSLHAGLLNEDTATTISLAVYTIIGIATYFYGLSNKLNGLRIYGGVILGMVVLRMLFIDVWEMEISGRIVTFFVMGALLTGTAFLGKKKQLANNQQ